MFLCNIYLYVREKFMSINSVILFYSVILLYKPYYYDACWAVCNMCVCELGPAHVLSIYVKTEVVLWISNSRDFPTHLFMVSELLSWGMEATTCSSA